MPEPRPGRIIRHGERARIRTPGVGPPLMVAMAHADRPRGPAALRDTAGIAAEHRAGRIEHQDAGPELRAHRGHQLLQQAGRKTGVPFVDGVSVTSSSPSACRHSPNSPRLPAAGARTWPDRAPPDAVTVHAITAMPGCSTRMAASSVAAL